MPQQSKTSDFEPFVRRLESIVSLSPDEQQALRDLPMVIRDLKEDEHIVREGDRPHACCLILEGFAFRYKLLQKGGRQIFSFHAPGEMPDLLSLFLSVMDHSVATLCPVRAAFVSHDDVRALLNRWPRIAGALWRETLIDAAIFRQWMLGLGRQDAPERIAHFFCEMYTRLEAIGRVQDSTAYLPVTQHELADALGVSNVHANRTLQDLRSRGLISFDRGRLTIHDWPRLAELGEFDPAYLHQDPATEPVPA